MLLRPERFLSEPYLAARAAENLRRYFQRKPPARLPVPVEDLAEELFDLSISWERVQPENGSLILGGVRPERRQLVLNDDARSYFSEFPGSENFTKAHEVGHWVLHVREPPASAQLFDLPDAPTIVCTSRDPKPPREVQADIFASLLLMPADLLLPECAKRDLSRWPNLYRLRDFLGVSISALRYRLEELNVLRVTPGGGIELLGAV